MTTSYIQNGKLVMSVYDYGRYERSLVCPRPDPNSYPYLVQFVLDRIYFILAVAIDGTVWVLRDSTMLKIPDLDNILAITSFADHCKLRMITTEGLFMEVKIDKDLAILNTIIYKCPGRIVQADYPFLLCSNGLLYNINNLVEPVQSNIKQIFTKYGVLYTLSNDGEMSPDPEKPVSDIVKFCGHVFGNEYTVLTSDGRLITPKYTITIKNPENVVQMYANTAACFVLYRSGKMCTYTIPGALKCMSDHDVDCLPGQIIRPRTTKSARNHAE